MGQRAHLRRIGAPVVAGPPSGVRIRTRIHVMEAEAAALSVVGSFLGGVYRVELAGRVRAGHLDRPSQAVWRAERKQAVTVVASSRWAGAITRAVEDQYQLGMRGVAVHVGDLRRAVEVLEARCALRPGESAPVDAGDVGGRGRRRRGYRSASERFAKTRRLAGLRSRLAAAEEALTAGWPSVTVGGKRLWRNRHDLDAAAMTELQWRARWDAAGMFLTADGETGKAGGNETIRVDEAGQLRIKVPAALTDLFGSHLQIAVPVGFAHRGQEWAARVAGRRAVRYDISYDPAKDRWYLDASWKHDVAAEPPSLGGLRTGSVLGVDLNADHLACCVLDGSGNPVGGAGVDPRADGWYARILPGWPGAGGDHRLAQPERPTELLGSGNREPRLRRRPRHRPRHDGSRAAGETVPPHRGRDPHREVPQPADCDGGPP
jgi:hypothetical protein